MQLRPYTTVKLMLKSLKTFKIQAFADLRHPFKASIPASQFLRQRKLCSEDDDFEEAATTMESKILSRNYNILTNDDSTRVIFPQPPLKAYRRAQNLRDLLVHSDFPLDQPAQPGTFPCKRTICRTCAHINQSTSIPSPGGHIKITGHFTCTSDNVIYCISCRKCPETVYIGETGRRLADRFREHRLDALHKKIDLPVAQHFNSPGHSLEDVRVAVLKSGLAKKDVRQREEMRQIFIFQTLAPRGINRDFSFI